MTLGRPHEPNPDGLTRSACVVSRNVCCKVSCWHVVTIALATTRDALYGRNDSLNYYRQHLSRNRNLVCYTRLEEGGCNCAEDEHARCLGRTKVAAGTGGRGRGRCRGRRLGSGNRSRPGGRAGCGTTGSSRGTVGRTDFGGGRRRRRRGRSDTRRWARVWHSVRRADRIVQGRSRGTLRCRDDGCGYRAFQDIKRLALSEGFCTVRSITTWFRLTRRIRSEHGVQHVAGPSTGLCDWRVVGWVEVAGTGDRNVLRDEGGVVVAQDPVDGRQGRAADQGLDHADVEHVVSPSVPCCVRPDPLESTPHSQGESGPGS